MFDNNEDPLDSWYNIMGCGILLVAALLVVLAILDIWVQAYWLVVLICSLFFFGAGSHKQGS